MKQHIKPDQFKQMDDIFAMVLFDLVPRKDWYRYHHKKVTIGKMIEILQEKDKDSLSRVLLSYHDHLVHNVDYNLCDKLWEHVKSLK